MHAKLQGTITMNKSKLVKILAEGGIDVNQKFKSGLTKIVTANPGNNAKNIKILLDNEADLRTKNSLG